MTSEATTADDTGAIKSDKGTKKAGRSVWLFVRDILLIFLAALLISFLVKTFLIRSFYIPSGSMEDTLHINDRIIVNELVPDLVGIQRGDVVVFQDPGGWLTNVPQPQRSPIEEGTDAVLGFIGLTAPDSNDHLIKRVIGLPGDTITCCNDFGQMSVNGHPIEEPYLKLPDGVTKASGIDFDVTVPKGYLWVMGDNRYSSRDSRYNQSGPTHGFVPIDKVVGRAFLISWPAGHWGWLDNYPLTFQGVDKDTKDKQ